MGVGLCQAQEDGREDGGEAGEHRGGAPPPSGTAGGVGWTGNEAIPGARSL